MTDRKAYQSAYYQKNLDKLREQHRAWRRRTYVPKERTQAVIPVIKAALRALKESRPCVDCGRHYPHYVMDFDHIDPSTKRFSIAQFNSRRVEELQAELDKCELVCANCHRIRTHKRPHRN